MIRRLAAGLVGLGLVGGAGTVIYNHNGSTTVRVKQANGKVESVNIAGQGKSYSCPGGTQKKLEPYDLAAGRIKLTLLRVRAVERRIERRYPGKYGPPAIARRYNALVRRDNRLVTAFNRMIDAHNAIIDRNCTAGSG